MKKALMVIAAVGVAAFAQQKFRQNQAGKDLWAKAVDQPGAGPVDTAASQS